MNKILDYSSNTLIDTRCADEIPKVFNTKGIKLLQSIKYPEARCLKCFRAFFRGSFANNTCSYFTMQSNTLDLTNNYDNLSIHPSKHKLEVLFLIAFLPFILFNKDKTDQM